MVRCTRWLALLIIYVVFTSFSSGAAAEQSAEPSWRAPEGVFTELAGEYTNELWMLRDPADMLYLWWPVFPAEGDYLSPQQIRSQSAVFHTVWHNGVWQKPRDILVWPNAGNNLLAAVMDSQGVIHAFSKTDCLSYTSVKHTLSMDPKAWNERRCVDSMGVSNIAVAVDPNDRIYLAYAAEDTQAIRVAISENYGMDWESHEVATIMQYEGPTDGYFTDPDLFVDQQKRIHVVWSPATPPDGYPLLGTLYARSDDGGYTWTPPIQLGHAREGQPTLAVHQNDVHVLWNGDASNPGRFYRYSPDGGASWQDIEKLGDGGGLQRKPALIVDNRGNLHVMLHEQQNLFYLSKIGGQWSVKQPLYSAPERSAVEVFTIRLAITGGNQLHAAYTLMTEQNPDGRAIYHQVRPIDALPVEPSPMPAPPMPLEATPTLATIPYNSLAGLPTDAPMRPLLARTENASLPNSLGVVLIVSSVMVGSTVLLVLIRRQRRG